MSTTIRRIMAWLFVVGLFWAPFAGAQKPAAVSSPRVYVFDDGRIKALDPALFNFKPGELKEGDLVMASYLIVHPKGTLMFDSGGIPDSAFQAGDGTVTKGIMSAKPLLPQLAAIGYKPSVITYFALSHYHSDHTGNANAFAGSTWIVQKAERDFMFGQHPKGTIIDTSTFADLEHAKSRILDNESLDVFGDGSVVVMPAPGHTPGHQVVAVKLAHAGMIVLGGDLYHYPEERTTGRVPTFEYNADESRTSRAKIEAFLNKTHGTLWIEHDLATFEKLPHSPQYVD